jgi:hypothetical protein
MALIHVYIRRNVDVLHSLYPRPSSAAVALTSMPRQPAGHAPRPGSAIPVEGVLDTSRPPDFARKVRNSKMLEYTVNDNRNSTILSRCFAEGITFSLSGWLYMWNAAHARMSGVNLLAHLMVLCCML